MIICGEGLGRSKKLLSFDGGNSKSCYLLRGRAEVQQILSFKRACGNPKSYHLLRGRVEIRELSFEKTGGNSRSYYLLRGRVDIRNVVIGWEA